jgi:hypothetical protein
MNSFIEKWQRKSVPDKPVAQKRTIPARLKVVQENNDGVIISEGVGPCPHCGSPLLVFTHELDDEIWIQCPEEEKRWFKSVKWPKVGEEPAICTDCEISPTLIASWCSGCIQKFMFCPDEPCPSCEKMSYWRPRIIAEGSEVAWYCGNCVPPDNLFVTWHHLL